MFWDYYRETRHDNIKHPNPANKAINGSNMTPIFNLWMYKSVSAEDQLRYNAHCHFPSNRKTEQVSKSHSWVFVKLSVGNNRHGQAARNLHGVFDLTWMLFILQYGKFWQVLYKWKPFLMCYIKICRDLCCEIEMLRLKLYFRENNEQ